MSNSSIKFDRYDKIEVEKIVNAFVADLAPRYNDGTSEMETSAWTELVLDRFAECAPTSAVVDASPAKNGKAAPWMPDGLRNLAIRRETAGECLFDLAHWRLPKYDAGKYGSKEWWSGALQVPGGPRLLMALECEMGTMRSSAGTLRKVMDDAVKLLAAASLVKIMVVASPNADSLKELLDLLKALSAADPLRAADVELPQPTWAYIDLPWDRAREPTGGIL